MVVILCKQKEFWKVVLENGKKRRKEQLFEEVLLVDFFIKQIEKFA